MNFSTRTKAYGSSVSRPPASMAGEGEGWARLTRSLKAELDEGLIETYSGTVSLPFEAKPKTKVAVKIVYDRGIESLRILEVE